MQVNSLGKVYLFILNFIFINESRRFIETIQSIIDNCYISVSFKFFFKQRYYGFWIMFYSFLPSTPGGRTNRISHLPAPLLGLSLLYKLPKYILYLIETFILILQSKIQYRNSKVQKEVSLIWTSCNNSNYSLLL